MDIIYINFKAASNKFGFFEIQLATYTFTNFLEKICIKKARIIGHISMNS